MKLNVKFHFFRKYFHGINDDDFQIEYQTLSDFHHMRCLLVIDED